MDKSSQLKDKEDKANEIAALANAVGSSNGGNTIVVQQGGSNSGGMTIVEQPKAYNDELSINRLVGANA
jgi:hypothetical protein